MAIVTPYDDLQGDAKTVGGTWTKISGPGPAAPVLYDDSIDFAATADGQSVYEYEVTSSTCTHTARITYNSITPLARVNDTCDAATTLFSSSVVHYNDERCPGMVAPTDSGVGAPSGWSSAEPDLWYKFYVPTSPSVKTYEFIVDGASYIDGITQPMAAIYSGACGALVEEDSNVGASHTVSTNVTVAAVATPMWLYFRVASTTANAGSFDIIINEL